MRKLLLLILLYTCVNCNNTKSKRQYFSTTKICKDIYIERYVIFGSGAYGGDLHAKYLTDSIHFRLYIGTENTESENLFTECKGDSLIVEKYKTNAQNDSLYLFESKVYSKEKLIRQGHFE